MTRKQIQAYMRQQLAGFGRGFSYDVMATSDDTLYQGTGDWEGCFTTWQDALASARPGDQVHVGIYSGKGYTRELEEVKTIHIPPSKPQ